MEVTEAMVDQAVSGVNNRFGSSCWRIVARVSVSYRTRIPGDLEDLPFSGFLP